ncbi:transposase [Wolbachia endosymbiont of Muscidifurax uniraptor]|uniref:transposase n=1 Tax=Wolbachia endosymbiont of Muscidifurax uniraptor TaxID=77037 RepID=UPI0021009717|nr:MULTISPECIES: transposase [Wolbachia]
MGKNRKTLQSIVQERRKATKIQKCEIVNAILYILRTGCQWRYLPHDFPPWKAVHEQFRRWKKQRIFEKMNYDITKYSRSKMGSRAHA